LISARAALYLRVSRDGQPVENQRLALEAVATQRGWAVITQYADNGISGAKGRDQRPQLDALLKDASRGRFDVVMVWALDRLGRSLRHLMDTLHELEAAHVDLFLHQQAVDTTTPAGKAMYQMLGVFAEFERAMIQARINAGLARAREHGTKSGKPIGRPTLSPKLAAAVRRHLRAGTGILKTARLVGVGSGTVQRIRREMAA
jgi:DNA invertase Pin-like site-specific DNA recombinase